MIEVGNCYRIAGRQPIVVVRLGYGMGKRYTVEGYTPKRYAQYLKFNRYDPKTLKTVAELENTPRPPITSFRFNSKSKVEELDIKTAVPGWDVLNPTYSTDEIDEALSKPRR